MPTTRYMIDGERVPGTTTVVGRFKDSGGLIHWAWNLGMQGIDYKAKRDSAADTGSYGHAMIEQRVKGLPIECPSEATDTQREQAQKCLDNFDNWAAQNKMEIVATEMNLVSKDYLFGGTPDAVARLNGKLTLLDFKTSNRTYGEYAVQLAAYRHLLNEGYLFKPKVKTEDLERCPWTGITDCHLLRIGKEFCEFHHASWGEDVLDFCWDAFKEMRSLYTKVARIKNLA